MNVHYECNNKESYIYCHCSFFAEENDYKITKFQDCAKGMAMPQDQVIYCH